VFDDHSDYADWIWAQDSTVSMLLDLGTHKSDHESSLPLLGESWSIIKFETSLATQLQDVSLHFQIHPTFFGKELLKMAPPKD